MSLALPELHPADFAATRDAWHAYSRILGGWLSASRERRKHWWHISLRPSLCGLTTGIVHAGDTSFEMELNLRMGQLNVSTSGGDRIQLSLHGQSAAEPADRLQEFLLGAGLPIELVRAANGGNLDYRGRSFPAYDAGESVKLAAALDAVYAALAHCRAGIREETSPIGLWPHHFDLAMLWLPGGRIPGQDPADEEQADQQMNFGFTFGDEGIPEPYFYVTIYPLPEDFPATDLPQDTNWHSEGFTGAVLLYRDWLRQSDPNAYLLQLWREILAEGRVKLNKMSTQGGT